ncbi:MAG: PEP-CTERM sorting domain-containing protein [Microcoleus sp. PH2017_10_PVI_O_A]|uniref:PEP-CTERM sorting domain-containing protein n=1 Tax=unclassified Microcoleus TaxID=2642155 RepID=UPI001D5297D6|nr:MULTISPECIES: PEP-CTERM sorting domain-containing protein [unclassified Microcoleus]TAE81650.1 MAG: PEP-CTERM sorting domain-containing protein [Oscillatoriales cyanobacterium]MCC3407113.1 PEP-CTERM sorting domain-containing protein [Microcoleus sp. PH2017_10_PVI_O_A]MCC3461123.1 PEP-CTERM sorting domain-containing protein [Microcoleus sp. PH2017_11_PCY_U_A]MCC3479639.1 PEP-CTERM sorting domain-containing protein [Microcoleus sp. PH2017_12_PCY_D_A]MCC3529744.1 PEP-CTERM sorting domain-conta
MAKYKGSQLSVAIASRVLACGVILTQFAAEAQAATLTYNFTVDATSLFQSFPEPYIANYSGSFSFDNSSLTGVGDESVSVLSGVFNYLLPLDRHREPQIPFSYNFLGTPLAITESWYLYRVSGGVVNVRSGRLVGLSFSGNSFLDPHNAIWRIDNNQFVSDRRSMGRPNAGGQTATVSYFGPEIVVSEPVPEPTTIAGAILGLTSILAVKKRKKMVSN